MSKKNINLTLLLEATALVLGLAGGSAMAQAWPSKSISLIVPFPAGGTTDVLARAVGQELSKNLGQPVIVESKPGAGATLGADFVAKAKPDGYTLLAGSSTTLAANVGLFKTLPYDPQKDFQAVAGLGSTSMMFMVRSDFPAKDLKSFLAYASQQTNPMPVAYGSSSAQVALALLSKISGEDKPHQEQAFMVGMFSLLGVLFGMALDEVLKPLTVSDVSLV